MTLFDEIRSACREVAAGAKFVRIDEIRLREYVRSLSLPNLAQSMLDPAAHFLGHGEQTVGFVIILDTVNFGSGWFPYLRKRPGRSGYFTIATALREAFEAGHDFSAESLIQLSSAECADIFGQAPAVGPVDDLMDKYATALNQLGHLLLERYAGRFTALVENAEGSVETLMSSLRAMPYFEDVELWNGRRVPFYKRAQLTVADLAKAFQTVGWGHFRDLRQLTIFADNLVPHVLRLDGVLRYDPALSSRIDTEELIPAG